MGGKPRAAAGDVAALIATVRGCPAWDESRPFESPVRRRWAWNRQIKAARAAARAIEELARGRHRAELVALLDHPSGDVRADVAAALCGYSTANSGHRPTRWGRAGRAELEAVAGLLGDFAGRGRASRPPAKSGNNDTWQRTDRWAMRAAFALDPDAAAARLRAALRPEVEALPLGPPHLRDLIDAIPDGDPSLDAAIAAALEWAGDDLLYALVRHLETRAPRQLVAGLALDIDDHRFDHLMSRLRRIDDPALASWLAETARAPGLDPTRAARLRRLAGVDPPAAAPPRTPLSIAAEAGWDGGPMVLLSHADAPAWEGADPPSGGRVVDTDHRWNDVDDPATDYDLACASSFGGAALIAAGDGLALVTPTSYAAIATNPDVAGFFVVVAGDDEMLARWAGSETGWRRLGTLEIRGGAHLQSAALRGGERRGVAVGLALGVADGRYAVDELAFVDERGEIHLIRALRS